MKKRTKNIMKIGVFLILSPFVYYCFLLMWGFLDPDLYYRREQKYMNVPSECLIKKLSFSIPFIHTDLIALKVLGERKEKKAVPYILRLLKSPLKYERDSAMRELGGMGDLRAIEPLMKIVKKGERHPDYKDALYALSRLKYEGAFPYVAELAKKNDAWAIDMLEVFGKPEGIPLLKEMGENIKGSSYNDITKREDIDEAIKHIESVNQIRGN